MVLTNSHQIYTSPKGRSEAEQHFGGKRGYGVCWFNVEDTSEREKAISDAFRGYSANSMMSFIEMLQGMMDPKALVAMRAQEAMSIENAAPLEDKKGIPQIRYFDTDDEAFDFANSLKYDQLSPSAGIAVVEYRPNAFSCEYIATVLEAGLCNLDVPLRTVEGYISVPESALVQERLFDSIASDDDAFKVFMDAVRNVPPENDGPVTDEDYENLK